MLSQTNSTLFKSLAGMSKRKYSYLRDPSNKGPPTKKYQHELDNGMVALPAKTCFMCSKYVNLL